MNGLDQILISLKTFSKVSPVVMCKWKKYQGAHFEFFFTVRHNMRVNIYPM
jgi:hypothetical protein